jgi:hypothetical protein
MRRRTCRSIQAKVKALNSHLAAAAAAGFRTDGTPVDRGVALNGDRAAQLPAGKRPEY